MLVAVDTETSALDSMAADLVGISLALGPNDACYIPLAHGGTDMFAEKPDQIALDDALAALRPMLASDAVTKILHNGKYDLNVLARYEVEVAPIDVEQVPSPEVSAWAEACALVVELRGRGRSFQAIADQLNADAVPTKSGKGRWSKGAVGRALDEATEPNPEPSTEAVAVVPLSAEAWAAGIDAPNPATAASVLPDEITQRVHDRAARWAEAIR